MATATSRASSVRTVPGAAKPTIWAWQGVDKAGKKVRGEMRAASEAVVSNALRRQGIKVEKIKKQTFRGGGSIKEKEIALFTRQLATMTRAGVPLLQAFDIAARSTGNNRFSRLLLEIKGDIESGNSLAVSFKRHPMQFDELYCNLVGAGEQAGI
jgi:type IV pilus assembly protein PilC